MNKLKKTLAIAMIAGTIAGSAKANIYPIHAINPKASTILLKAGSFFANKSLLLKE